MYLEFDNINQSFIELSKILKNEGVKRETRGKTCYEINEPVLIKINNPTDRYLNVKRKGYNKYLPFAETLSILAGINDLRMPGTYTPNLYNYSDNGKFQRAMYGTRFRAMTGMATDYTVSSPLTRNIFSGFVKTVDQFKYVIEAFKRDPQTRQAILEIGDPVKDSFDEQDNIKQTKDYPCTRSLMFQLRDGKLDLTVTMRSNDHVWGAHTCNFTNFMFIQEIVANILGYPIGNYYHMANNYHFYDSHENLMEEISVLDSNEFSTFEKFQYNMFQLNFEEFDNKVNNLFFYEEKLRTGECSELVEFGNDMFDDWAKIFVKYWTKSKVEFKNPYLNRLFYGTSNS